MKKSVLFSILTAGVLSGALFAGEIDIRQMETLYKESREQKISDLSKMFPLTAVKKKPDFGMHSSIILKIPTSREPVNYSIQ